MGNQHHIFTASTYRRGGGFHFSSVIGSALDENLWEIVCDWIRPIGMRVYHPNEPTWTDSHIGRHLIIYLDDADRVKDVYFTP